jgi:hypothetical protein
MCAVVGCEWHDHIRADGWCSAVGILLSCTIHTIICVLLLQAVAGRTISELMAGTEQLVLYHPYSHICLVVRCGWQDHIRADGWYRAVGTVPSTLSYVFLFQAVVGRTISELMAGTEQLISCTIHMCVVLTGCGW